MKVISQKGDLFVYLSKRGRMSIIIDKVNQLHERKKIADISTGDRVRVHQKIREGNKERIQVFEGVVIKTSGGKGIQGSFTVRRIASSIGVEKTFPLHLPTIVKVEKLKSAKVGQSRIYYVRGLVGRAAKRLKKEKEVDDVWEGVIEEKAESKDAEPVASEETESKDEAKSEDKDKAKAEDESEAKPDTAENGDAAEAEAEIAENK
jgi:large subunit ribosomal protein L19